MKQLSVRGYAEHRDETEEEGTFYQAVSHRRAWIAISVKKVQPKVFFTRLIRLIRAGTCRFSQKLQKSD